MDPSSRSATMTLKGVRRYCLHGLQIQARAHDPRLAAAMEGLFERYAVQGRAVPSCDDTLDCTLETIDDLSGVVPVDTSVLYEQAGLRYGGQGGHLFVEAAGLSVSLADLESRRIQVYVLRKHTDALWSIQHFAILPLIMEFLRLRGLYPVHAAALEQNGLALILPALPGGGKSTLAIALLQAGLRLLSDDMPFLSRREGKSEVLAFPEDINICADGIGHFEELAFLASCSPNERGKHSVPVERLFPGSLAERGHPRFLVFPRIARTPGSHLEPMGKSEASLVLLEHSLPPLNRALAAAHFELLMDTLISCDCYRLETGLDPREAAGQLIDLMESVPPVTTSIQV